MRVKTRMVFALFSVLFVFILCFHIIGLIHRENSRPESEEILLQATKRDIFDESAYDRTDAQLICPQTSLSFWDAFNRTKSKVCRSKFAYAFCQPNSTAALHVQTQCIEREQHTHVSKRLGCFTISLREILSRKLGLPRNCSDCIRWCQAAASPYALCAASDTCVCSSYRPTGSLSDPGLACPTACSLSQTNNRLLPPCNKTMLVEVFSTGVLSPSVLKAARPDGLTLPLDSEPVRVVYVLICHGRNWQQLKQLFQLIYSSRHYYYIHIDLRSNYLYHQARQLIKQYPQNVHLADQRWETIWGGTALLSMLLSAMKELLTTLDAWRWDFLINLSGSDLPIRPHKELITYLSQNRGKIFLGFTRNRARHLEDQGLDGVFVDCDRYVWFLGRRPLPVGIILDGGSDWMTLPREFVEYVSFTEDEVVQKIRQYYRYALLPVESFFHVVAHNTRFCSNVVNDNLRLINWDKPRGCECKHQRSVDWCGCSPVLFRGSQAVERLCDVLLHSCSKNASRTTAVGRPVFFARKFDPTVDLNVINFVTTRLLGKKNGYPGRNYYLENIYSAQVDTVEVPTSWSQVLEFLARKSFHWLLSTDPVLRTWDLSNNWNRRLNVFGLFNASEQNYSDPLLAIRPLIPRPPKLVFQLAISTQHRFDSTQVAQVEFLMQVPFLGWSTDQPLSQHRMHDIVYMEVSSGFEFKDQVIRNYPRVNTIDDKLQLIIIWKGVTGIQSNPPLSLHLDLRNPQNQSCSDVTPFMLAVTRELHHPFNCKTCQVSVTPLESVLHSCALEPGLWHLAARGPTAAAVLAQFFLLPSVQSDRSVFQYHLTSNASPWSKPFVQDHCWMLRKTTGHSNLHQEPYCANKAWSSMTPDRE